MSDFDLKGYLHEARAEVDAWLDALLPAETAPPALIHRAMRYAVFAGGKRLRPILMAAGCEAAGGGRARTREFACAVECIHTYSLVHDDLPALDNDDLRRGRPTVHKAFDEATAILVGDALLTVAVRMAIGRTEDPVSEIPADRRLQALGVLTTAIGTAGMIGGQVDDLQATRAPADEDTVRSIHARKTGALLRACPVIGGILAGAPADTVERLGAYGDDLGLAFQIIDDILDIEGTPQSLGKTSGKDAAAGKATFPAVLGLERSRALAGQLAARAEQTADSFGPAARPLAALARYVVQRKQ